MNSPQIRIEKRTHKELKILRAVLEHVSASETIQFLLDEYEKQKEAIKNADGKGKHKTSGKEGTNA